MRETWEKMHVKLMPSAKASNREFLRNYKSQRKEDIYIGIKKSISSNTANSNMNKTKLNSLEIFKFQKQSNS